MRLKPVIASLLLLGLSSSAWAETYSIDPNHTQVRFRYQHFGLSTIVGMFTGISGSISYDPADPAASKVEVVIPIKEVHTGVADFNDHLRSADFFDVATYPEARFRSTAVKAVGEHALQVEGELTVRDKTHPVVLDVTLNAVKNHPMHGRPVIGLDARTQLKRTELGVGKYAPNVDDVVNIEITAEANVPKPAG